MEIKKSILFIDDNLLDRTFIQRILTKSDFNVYLAEDGPKGLAMALEKKPDLVLLDILLPGISGIEICKKLKSNPSTKEIPIIFYSAIDTPKHMIDYASCGAQDYIQKSMPPEELIDSINSVLT